MKSGAVSGHTVITNVWRSFSPEPSFSPSAFLNVGRERRVRMSKRQTFWHIQVKGLSLSHGNSKSVWHLLIHL